MPVTTLFTDPKSKWMKDTPEEPSMKRIVPSWLSLAWDTVTAPPSPKASSSTKTNKTTRPCPCQESQDSDRDSDSEYETAAGRRCSYYASLAEFLDRVQDSDCIRCSHFAQAITFTKHLDKLNKESCIVTAMGSSPTEYLEGYHVSLGRLPDAGSFSYELAVPTDQADGVSPFVSSFDGFHYDRMILLPKSTSSEESISWATARLHDCLAFHDHCSRPLGTKMPRRLLNLNAESDTIKLVKDLDEAQYACLSHCWGGKSHLKTLESNVQSHEAGLPLSSIGQTFQDAVKIVRALRLQYLWIDTFCIVQDDDVERGEEIASMCEIYRNCTICIAATAGINSSSGCFTEVDEEYVGLPIANLESAAQGSKSLYFRRIPDHSDFLVGKPDGVPSPLLTRGCSFQERILAPRILHFTASELVFECREHVVCQCGTLERRQDEEPYKYSCDVPSDNQGEAPTSPNGWYALVQEYTELKLSVSSDRLPALAGLARDWSSMNLGTYLGGIWEHSAALGLSWQLKFQLQPRLKVWQAPSWSWASVSGAIGFAGGGEVMIKPVLELLSFDYHTNTTDTFGQAVYGSLVVSAPTAHIRFRAKRQQRLRYTFSDDDDESQSQPEETEIFTTLYDMNGLKIHPINMYGTRLDYELTTEQTEEFDQHDEVIMVQLGLKLNIPDPYPYEVNGRYIALLLKAVPGDI